MITSCPAVRGDDLRSRRTNSRSRKSEVFHLILEVGSRGMILKEIVSGELRGRRTATGTMVRTRGRSRGGESPSPKNRLEVEGNVNGVHLNITVSLLHSGNLTVKVEASRGSDGIAVRFSAENGMLLGVNMVEIPVHFRRMVLTLLDPEYAAIPLGEGIVDVCRMITEFEVERKRNLDRRSTPRKSHGEGNAGEALTEGDLGKVRMVEMSWLEYSAGVSLWKELLPGSGIIGAENSPLEEVVEDMCTASSDDEPVLITGVTGSGKGLIARAIHDRSRRKNRPFQEAAWTSVPKSLIESAFFGHEKDAFTGATCRKSGWFEQAHTGTLFLDEIGDMPYYLQTRLLKPLEEKKIQRIGGNAEITVDLRVISATNRDLEKEVEARQFREDLYYRIKGHVISLPPLRERGWDIPALIDYFAGRKNRRLAEPLFKALIWHEWKGNVRQLRNLLESNSAGAQGTIDLSDIKPRRDRERLRKAYREYLEAAGEVGACDEKANVVNELVAIITRMLRKAWDYAEDESDLEKKRRRDAAVRVAKEHFREFLLSRGYTAARALPPESTCTELLSACFPKRADRKDIRVGTLAMLREKNRASRLSLSNTTENRSYETLEAFLGISYKWFRTCLDLKKEARTP